DNPLGTWSESYRDAYLDAFFGLEGRGRMYTQGCTVCGNPDPQWRCLDCHGCRMVCQDCLISKHKDEPTHRIEV
ncbi:hypothetical protein H0H92_007816, partial [Tricholoma furcatifolium]